MVIAPHGSGGARLIEMRAVSERYPLYGEIATEPLLHEHRATYRDSLGVGERVVEGAEFNDAAAQDVEETKFLGPRTCTSDPGLTPLAAHPSGDVAARLTSDREWQ